jgi:transcriptional regulator with XRE-family HTH domain
LPVIVGKGLPSVKAVTTLFVATPLPKARNTVPAMPKKTMSEVLAENVRALMQMAPHRDLNTDRKLGKKAGVSHKTINNVLNGRHDVHMSKVEKIAAAFRMSPHQLLCPSTDRQFLVISQVYSEADIDGKAFLMSAAEIVSRRTANGIERAVTDASKAKR